MNLSPKGTEFIKFSPFSLYIRFFQGGIMPKYGFLTTTNIIFSLVVGSGIFFKIDDIILASANQLIPTLIIFLVVMVSVISGVIILSIYPQVDKDNQGLTTYFNLAGSPKLNYLFNYFLIAIYFPTLVVVLALSASQYFFTALNLTNPTIILIGSLALSILSYLISKNKLSLSVFIQNISTILKYLALILLITFGFNYAATNSTTHTELATTNIKSGIIALTFAFDGWIMVMGFSNRIKNFTRTLPIALITAVSLISLFYFSFIWSMGSVVNTNFIIDDTLIYQIAELLFNDVAAILINLIIAVCIFGALHATILTYVNFVQTYKNEQPETSSNIDRNIFGLILFYFFLQSLTYYTNTINLDVSELCIVGAYLFYLLLYIKTIKIIKNNNFNKTYYLSLVIALISGLIILLASLLGGGQVYFIITLLILCYSYYQQYCR